jgi:hypothetical protein
LSSITIHAGYEEFACSEGDCLFGPFDGIESCGGSSTEGEDFPVVVNSSGIDCDYDALVAEFFRRFGDEGRVFDGCSVERNFVCAGEET